MVISALECCFLSFIQFYELIWFRIFILSYLSIRLVLLIYIDKKNVFHVQFRHLEVKKEKEIQRVTLIKFLNDAISSQFRNPSVWN